MVSRVIRRLSVAAVVVAAATGFFGPASVEAATKYDLTTVGSTATICAGTGGTQPCAVFTQVSPQPTGTGYIDPFVRLQSKGTEQGYNTSSRPVQFDEKTLNGNLTWTHDLLLSDVGKVTVNGTQYYRFLLDINESNSTSNHLLSLDRLQVFVSPTASLNNYVFTGSQSKTGYLADPNAGSGKATLVYDIDSNDGPPPDNYVLLNYSLNSGSGSGDMLFDVPVSAFPTCVGCYLYLYSKFGEQDQSSLDATSDAGFEEWTALKSTLPPPPSVSQPLSLVLLASGMAGLGLWRRCRRPKP